MNLYGIAASFAGEEELLIAVEAASAAGYREIEAFTPFPVARLARSLGFRESTIPVLAWVGGVLGGATMLGLQIYAVAVDYPINVGGRPLVALEAFTIPTFEMTVLGAFVAAVVGMLALNRLPRLHHPMFDVPGFREATDHAFMICIGAADPHFDRRDTADFLRRCGATNVHEVAP